jgi:predicted exporter
MHFSNWQNKLTAIWLIFLVIIAIGLGFTWMQKGIHIQTNIFALLPKVKQDKQLEQTEHYVSEQLNNKVFLVIDAKSSEQIDQATQILRAGVQQSNLFKPLKAQVDTEDFAKTLYAHHAGLISSQDQAILKQQDYAALTEQSLMQIMSPGMPITESLLQQDPLLLFPRYAMGLASLQQHSNIEIQDGFATISDEQGYSRLFNLELLKSPYDIEYQE